MTKECECGLRFTVNVGTSMQQAMTLSRWMRRHREADWRCNAGGPARIVVRESDRA